MSNVVVQANNVSFDITKIDDNIIVQTDGVNVTIDESSYAVNVSTLSNVIEISNTGIIVEKQYGNKISESTPLADILGQGWFNTTNQTLSIWTGDDWDMVGQDDGFY